MTHPSPPPPQFTNSSDTLVLISYVTDVNYSSFIIKEEDNEQATTYVHTFGILIEKTIESDNRECKYRRHFQGRERNRDSNSRFSFVIGNPIVLLPENLVTLKKERKKK